MIKYNVMWPGLSNFRTIILGLFVLGAVLRLWQYWYFPVYGETRDEVAWTMLGSSLLQTGVPKSWSYFEGYTVEKFVYEPNGREYPIVSPVLDHPPLFGFLPGLAHILRGGSWDQLPSLKAIRFPVVMLGILNLGLFIAWIQKTRLTARAQLIATCLAVTVPTWVFLSRLTVSENLIVTEMLLLFLVLSSQRTSTWKSAATFVTQAALPLTKVAGIPIGAALIYASVQEKNWSAVRLQLAGLMTGIVGWLLYSAVYDWDLFWQIQTQQAERSTGLLTLFSSFLWLNTIVFHEFPDVWSWMGVFALLALGVFISQERKGALEGNRVLVVALAILAFLVLSVGELTLHGWYHIPLWPLMAFVLGWLLDVVYQHGKAITLALLSLLLLPQFRLALVYLWQKDFYTWQGSLSKLFLLTIGGLFLLASWPYFTSRAKVLKKWFWGWLFLLFLANIITVLALQHQPYWEDAQYLEEGIRP